MGDRLRGPDARIVDDGEREGSELRTIMEWAKVGELVAKGLTQRQIAEQLGMNRRAAAWLAASPEPPRYEREPAGSALDVDEPLMREVLAEWPRIPAPRMTEILRAHGYEGSERVVRRRLARLRPPAVRAAQRTGHAPGQVAQIDWAEMEGRPRILGAERRIYALVQAPPTRAHKPSTSAST
jgi:transposase